jgi:hypothetical protein
MVEVVRQERRFLGWGVAISVVAHVVGVSLVEYLQPTSEEVAQRVLFVTPTVGGKFVMRPPRITKRLELRKVPREQGVRVEQGRVAAVTQEKGIVAKMAVTQAEMMAERVVRGAGGIGGRGSRVVGIGETGESANRRNQEREAGLRLREVGVAKEPERRVDLSLEMLDVQSMDTGRYRAMVIQNPRDKRASKGFVHIARVYSQTFQRSGMESGGSGDYNTALYNLAEAFRTYTGIHADFVGHVSFDDARLLEIPFIIYVTEGGPLTEEEVKNLATYLLHGGFIFGMSDWTEGLEKYAGLVKGRDFYTDRLPDDHPIFSSFFDMGPAGSPATTIGTKAGMLTRNYMIGLWVKGRLAGIDFPQGVGIAYWARAGRQHGMDSTRHLQFAINVIVYALTQEGSITHQLMQTVK